MDQEGIDTVLAFIETQGIKTLDLTGGAPEMNPHFRDLVQRARALGCTVIDRCNLTILQEPGYEDLAQFLASQKVHVSASLPCYTEQNVSEQRGKGVFQESIAALTRLNAWGYGVKSDLPLSLVYNPNGAFLPPPQESLEADYKRQLKEEHQIVFDNLLTITNMPISRFGSVLLSKGTYDEYMSLLRDNFSSSNLDTVMCRNILSVDWQGYVYDCDFNQMLAMPLVASRGVLASDKELRHLRELIHHDFTGAPIVVGEHCYACAAGQGSSCSGALS